MIVTLIARPQFLGLPSQLGIPRYDQLEGPDAQKLIETAGRTCYDSFGKGRNSSAYAEHILGSGHGSVLEHAQYSFFVSGISRGLGNELVRHRVGIAISQRSTRYVDESEGKWIAHPLADQLFEAEERETRAEVIPRRPSLEEEWNDLIHKARVLYLKIANAGEALLKSRGVDPLTARKQARGAARGALGIALETEMIWSANVRALRHVIAMRGDPAADGEIRELGVLLLKIMEGELPAFFGDFTIMPAQDGIGETVTVVNRKV